jgi:hypothetical protein
MVDAYLREINRTLKEISESLKIIAESLSKQEPEEHVIFTPWDPERSDDN